MWIAKELSALSTEEIEGIVSLKSALKSAFEGQDKDLINSAIQEINEYSSPIAHKVMDIVIQKAMKGQKV